MDIRNTVNPTFCRHDDPIYGMYDTIAGRYVTIDHFRVSEVDAISLALHHQSAASLVLHTHRNHHSVLTEHTLQYVVLDNLCKHKRNIALTNMFDFVSVTVAVVAVAQNRNRTPKSKRNFTSVH